DHAGEDHKFYMSGQSAGGCNKAGAQPCELHHGDPSHRKAHVSPPRYLATTGVALAAGGLVVSALSSSFVPGPYAGARSIGTTASFSGPLILSLCVGNCYLIEARLQTQSHQDGGDNMNATLGVVASMAVYDSVKDITDPKVSLVKAEAQSHRSIDSKSVTFVADYAAVNAAVGRLVASVPKETVSDVYNSLAGVVDASVHNNISPR
ncbi:unnamed protein product, partial [Symbiodinium sp. CCMP2456]